MSDAPELSDRNGVCVFAPSTIVTVTAEAGIDGDEVHFHAGGQGFWIARLLGRLGVPTVLSTVFGGESGLVARALAESEPISIRPVMASAPNGSWIHDRRDGERRSVAEDTGRPLDRHVIDELYGATLAAALDAGICVLAGPHRPRLISSTPYERLAADLRANGVVVVTDLSGEHLFAALRSGVDFCKVSDEDLAKTDDFDSLPIEAMLDRLRELGAANSAITRGADTLVAQIGDDAHEVMTPQLQAVDHRGAGDAFTALVAASAYWGLDWCEAIRWGAAAGALTVVRRGLATADRREIHQLLARTTLHPLLHG